MKKWFSFVLGNKRLLNFGFLFNFFSSFGQTFFISLFMPIWVESFQINNTFFGTLYASITMVSALLLWLLGRYIDRISLTRFSLFVVLALIASVMFLSRAENIVMLIAGLLMVRFLGQGLMSHTSATGIAKYSLSAQPQKASVWQRRDGCMESENSRSV